MIISFSAPLLPAESGNYVFYSANDTDEDNPYAIVQGQEYDDWIDYNLYFTCYLEADEAFTFSVASWYAPAQVQLYIETYELPKPVVLALGDTLVELKTDFRTVCTFTPEESGNYMFYSHDSDTDPVAFVDDNTYDDQNDMDFSFIMQLEAGVEFSFEVKCYDEDGEAYINVSRAG